MGQICSELKRYAQERAYFSYEQKNTDQVLDEHMCNKSRGDLTNLSPEFIVIKHISYLVKGYEEEEYIIRPVREERSPAERRFRKAVMEGSFGAGKMNGFGKIGRDVLTDR